MKIIFLPRRHPDSYRDTKKDSKLCAFLWAFVPIKSLLPGLVLIAITSLGQTGGPNFPSSEKVNRAMDEAMKGSDLPAVVAVAVNKQGQKVNYTFGKAIWTEPSPVTTQHIFRIYSMTKLVTSVAVLQLVEKGLVGLDDDLSTLMPEMTSIPILSDGQIVEPKVPITLRHLLTHTSGFGSTSTDEALSKFDRSNWKYRDLPRRFESGTQFLYGSSTVWAGRLVEKLSKKNLEVYFRENITGPLKMDRTWFNLPDSLKKYIVSAGRRGDDGKQPLVESPDRIPKNNVTEYNGGGGLYSTPEDFAKLLQCLLNEGSYGKGRLLKASTIQDIAKNQIGNVIMNAEDGYYAPASCCNFKGIISRSSKWGLAGLLDTEDKPYGRKAGTVSWGGLMNTYFYIDFKSGIAASIYTQQLPFNHASTTSLFNKFSETVYSKN